MEKRLIIFVVISLAIIFSYPIFINWVAPPALLTPPSVSESEKAEPLEEETEHPVASSEEPVSSSKEVGEDVDSVDEIVPFTEGEALEVVKVIESDLYRVTLSSLGGTVKKWELKKYTEKKETGDELIQLVFDQGHRLPLELIFPGESEQGKRVYQLDDTELLLDKAHPEGVVKMVSVDSAGRKITKELRFHYDQYLVDLKVETEGYEQGYDFSLGTNFGIHEWGQQIGRSGGAITLIDAEVFRDTPSKMDEDTTVYQGNPKWIGLQDKYFISALIPEEGFPVGPVSFQKEEEKEISAQVTLGEGSSTHRFSLYVGPKEYDRLNDLKVNLDESIDFGWFIGGSLLIVRLISKPIFYLLRFFNGFTHNYGVAIILVTVLIKALFYPITRKSMQSMKSMSTIQPKINAIKKQWASNKEKMNQEMIKLYKTEKVNPLGGCLPMLVQIPVFISLYNILYTTIALRQAPFFLWVQDLSVKDPYYVLPIVMGATMFLQQYTQPTAMESAQAKMMLFLPVVYTYFFLNFPSGLVLYWLVNNSLTIAQQYFLGKQGLSAAKIKASVSK